MDTVHYEARKLTNILRLLLRWMGRAGSGICVLLVSVTGCGPTVTPEPDPMTISFAYSSGDREYYEKQIRAFHEQASHITVELRSGGGGRFGWSRPEGADVFVSSQFALDTLREEDGILSITPFVETDESFDLSDYYPSIVEIYTTGGELWAVPSGADPLVMYYNRDIFDEHGIPYPDIGWTWDDFLAVGSTLTHVEMNVFGYAPHYELGIQFVLDPLAIIYQHGGRVFDDVAGSTRLVFDDPLTIEALKWYTGLWNEHGIAPSPEDVRESADVYINVWTGIVDGRFGMWTGLLSERGETTWPSDLRSRSGVVTLPRDQLSASVVLVDAYFISSDTPHPEECWNWLVFLSRQMPPTGVPTRRSLAESEAYDQQAGESIAAAARSSVESAMPFSSRLVWRWRRISPFVGAIRSIVGGHSTPEEAMAQAREQAEQ